MFRDLPDLPAGLDPFDFQKAMMALLGRILSGGEAWMLVAHTPNGDLPVGLVVGLMAGVYCEPRVFWFPEASPRNRLETALRFLIDLKQKYRLLIWAGPGDWTFFGHLCKYGVLRTVGKYRGYFPDGRDGLLFQGVT